MNVPRMVEKQPTNGGGKTVVREEPMKHLSTSANKSTLKKVFPQLTEKKTDRREMERRVSGKTRQETEETKSPVPKSR